MSHTLVVNLSDDAYAELLRASNEEHQTPEAIASELLDNFLPDPLLKLSGAIKTPISDTAIRHDEYIGEGIHSGHTG